MTFQDPYKQCFVNIANGYVKVLQVQQDGFLKQIGEIATIRKILVTLYSILLNAKKCEPIESMGEGEKRELWAEAKRISPIHERTYLIEVVKALYALGTFIELESNG